MQLQDFISESILQIVNGILDAQTKNITNARINPSNLKLGTKMTQQELYDFDNRMLLSRVEFDVAVNAEESAGAKGGIGKIDTKSSSINRIKFNVPIALPNGE